MITVLCLAETAWAVIAGLTRVEALGHPVRVRFPECHSEGGGRAGTHTVCSGPQIGDPARTVKVAYEGVDAGLLSWAIAVMLPVVPLLAAAVTRGAAVVGVRRWRGLDDWP